MFGFFQNEVLELYRLSVGVLSKARLLLAEEVSLVLKR
jgi:hypothetical protein